MATKDVEMKDVKDVDKKTTKEGEAKEPEKEKTPEEKEALLYADLVNYAQLVDKTANNKEMRHIHRAIRYTFARVRRKLNVKLLKKLINEFYPESQEKSNLLAALPEGEEMEIEGEKKKEEQPTNITPELEIYLWLLVVVFLLDNKKLDKGLELVTVLVDRLGTFNRRTLDPLSAKVYFYYSRAYELANRLADIRVKLLQLQRTATLRHNFDGQVITLNLLLRNYLHYNLYDQAEKLASKTDFKNNKASTNELARYHFYLGRINAVQLSYTDAYRNLQQALRKGPRDTARGFRTIVTKFLVIVQLLLGEIPERSIFRTKGIANALKPYLQLTQAVRSGDVQQFQKCVETYAESVFEKDKTHALIQRLHHNVIKTGLRKINASYSRISFAEICKKLSLDSIQDCEFIVSKAILDKIIDAKINHKEGYIQSNDNVDVYATNEPERSFHQRIEFCLQIHNDAVKAMRYPPDFKKTKAEKSEKKDVAETDIADLIHDDGEDE